MIGLTIYLTGYVISYITQYVDIVYVRKRIWTVGDRTGGLLISLTSWLFMLCYLAAWVSEKIDSDKPASW